MKNKSNKKSFDWYGKSQRFSIRKYHFGAASALLGTALLMGVGTEAKAEVTHNPDKSITYTDTNTKETVTVDAGFLAQNSITTVSPGYGAFADIPKTANDSTGAVEGADTLAGNIKGAVEYRDVDTNQEVKTKLENQDLGDVSLSTPYDKEKLAAEKDGKNYRDTTLSETTDQTVGKENTLVFNNKDYTYVRSELVGDVKKSVDVAESTFNDVTAKVTPEGLHTATGDINYTALPTGGKVYIVEELSDGVYGKYVEATSVASDEAVVAAFKAGLATAKDFTSANVGTLSANDILVIVDKDTYSVSNQDTLSFEQQTFTEMIIVKAGAKTLDFSTELGLPPTADDVIWWLDSWLANNNPELANLPKLEAFKFHAPVRSVNEIKVDGNESFNGADRVVFDWTPDKAVLDAVNAEFQAEKDKIYAEIRALNNWSLGATDERDDREIYGNKLIEAHAKIQNRIYEEFLATIPTITTGEKEVKTVITKSNGSTAWEYSISRNEGVYTGVSTDVSETGNYSIYQYMEEADPKTEGLSNLQDTTYSLITPVRAYRVATPEPLTLVHYYEEVKKGSVIVKYVETGTTTELKDQVVDVDNQPIKGATYDTTDNKPQEITAKDGKVYKLIAGAGLEAGSKSETGNLVEGITEVIYGYTLKTEETPDGAPTETKGNVIVKYFIENTETSIKDQAEAINDVVSRTQNFVTKSGNVVISNRTEVTPTNVTFDTKPLADATITAKDGKVYELVKLRSGEEAGTLKEGTAEVIYDYRLVTNESKDGELKDSKVGKVTVDYVLEDGTLIESAVDTPETAVEKTQTYVTKSGDVVISTRDEVTPVDVDYDTTDLKAEIKEFGGKQYYFVKVADNSKPEAGKVVEGETKVIYVYREIETGKPVPPLTIEIPNVEIKPEEKDGDAKDSKVGKVTVDYVLEDGTLIESTVDTPETAVEKTQRYVIKTADGVVLTSRDEVTSVDVDYNTEELKSEIKEFGGKQYYFVKVADNSKPEAGKVVEGETKVIYVYREIETGKPVPPLTIEIPNVEIKPEEKDGDAKDSKVGKVTVDYVLEDGTLIESTVDTPETAVEKTQRYVIKTADGVVLTSRDEVTSVDVDYNTEELKSEIKEFGGKQYYFVKVADNSKPEVGKVVEGETKVIYVYRLVEGEIPKLPVPTVDLPEIEIETKIPNDFPTVDLPEIEIETKVPNDFPTVDLPEIEIETKIPNDYPIHEKPELELPQPDPKPEPIPDPGPKPEPKPEPTPEPKQKPSPKVAKPATKATPAGALPKTSATRTETNTALPAGLAAALLAAGLLTTRRRKEDK
ncbi:MAG: YSIRK-type signal peptide-containing protein [Gemella sp.]|nr:YSIRK-type signal peptide-containing protein [Gemella sp.]